MTAQHGSSITLDYGPQGAQQNGSTLVLDYSFAVDPVRRRVVAGLHAPWPHARPMAQEVRAPYALAHSADIAHAGRWGVGRAVQARSNTPWSVVVPLDVLRRAMWGRFAALSFDELRLQWGVARRSDNGMQAAWGRYWARPSNDLRGNWLPSRVADHVRLAPWAAFASRPAHSVSADWPVTCRADLERWLPWLRYSRQINPGWGVLVPDGNPPVDEHGTVLVPVRKVYMTVNEVNLVRFDGAVTIPAYTFGMSLDVDSWTWSWSATLHADALPLIQPDLGGDPVDIQVTINGEAFRLAAESYSRQREFGNTRISVKGRGRAAILDAPYARVMNHGNTEARTAQQLMADVLTVNGVGIGWDVDWGLTDWLVPGNVWTHQGAYMSALQDIAQAAGGYIQPHDTAPTLRVLPRYPAAPWNWAGLTPAFELPSHPVQVEGIDWRRLPAYDRVFVEGVKAGSVRGQVTRTGTAGGLLAPMVVHPLITHADAARQRGIAELSNTGSQAHISLRLPVLEATGVIKPGALVRYVDGADTHLGLVRSTSVEWAMPTLRQVLTVETHPTE